MNMGELKDRVTILNLVKEGNTFSWKPNFALWGKHERLSGINLFSKLGLGLKSIKFTIRKRDGLTLHNAFSWKGNHCFLTDIIDINQMYQEINAALIEPVICAVERTGEPILDALNRPVYSGTETISFPGCLTEKYLGHTQEKPMSVTEVRYVLVTPKPIELTTGELVIIGDIAYTVLISHVLDEYKNEYEIVARRDA